MFLGSTHASQGEKSILDHIVLHLRVEHLEVIALLKFVTVDKLQHLKGNIMYLKDIREAKHHFLVLRLW